MGRIVKLLLYYFAYQLAFYGIFNELYKWHYGITEVSDPLSPSYVTLLLIIQIVSTVAIGLHVLIFKYVELDRKTWAYYKSGKLLSVVSIFIVGLSLWNNYLNELANLPNTMQDFFVSMMRHPLGIIATVILAPLVEELLFRGAIQGHLLRKWGSPALAIFISSLIFGMIHGNPAQIPFAFVIGVALGWVYYMTGSLVPGILMHFINNGTAVVAFWLSDNAESGLIDLLGPQAALIMAVAGVFLTFLGVKWIRALMVAHPVVWNETEKDA